MNQIGMNIRKSLLFASILMGGLTARAEVVIVADSVTTLPIAEVKSLSWTGNFNTGSLVVNYADGKQTSVPFSEITNVTLAPDVKEDETWVKPTMTDRRVRVSVSGDYLLLDGVSAGDVIVISNMAGQQVKRVKAVSCISLHSLPAGTYVAQVVGRSVKFVKR